MSQTTPRRHKEKLPASRRTAKSSIAASTDGVHQNSIQKSLALAKAQGLLSGRRTVVIQGRISAELVEEAKRCSGITSESKLIEAALANIAVDDYWEWMIAHRGTISRDLDLEF